MRNNSLIIVLFIAITTNGFAQGPNAAEAASFEPIDATDMVNLTTGSLTYVLPLLNVPSPDGGYPLVLSYHAGVAMDQEASWVGLGWNLNPGAINRSINGYPDDYNDSKLTEYFYDKGDEVSRYSLSLGYSAGVSVGVGLNWGSHQSVGGSVSIGFGISEVVGVSASAGTNGASVGINAGFQGGLSVGASLSTDGTVSGSLGFNSNEGGISIGASTNGAYNFSLTGGVGNENFATLGMNFSSSGVGISAKVVNGHTSTSKNSKGEATTSYNVDGGVGIGINIAHSNSISSGDYSSKSSSTTIPLIVPTPIGVFSLSFGMQKFKYYLGKKEYNHVAGPLYFDKIGRWNVNCFLTNPNGDPNPSCGGNIYNSLEEATSFAFSVFPDCNCEITNLHTGNFMDIYEFGVNTEDDEIELNLDVDANNLAFPSFDSYNLQAQGLSGGLVLNTLENGALFGVPNKETENGLKLKYLIDAKTVNWNLNFSKRPYFSLENEISTYLEVSKASFNNNSNNDNILSYLNYTNNTNINRKTAANFVKYYTNDELINNINVIKSEGYLSPEGTGFDRLSKPADGIGAFKVTGIDGKTYHYSLPVYNHEIITRTFGHVPTSLNENEAYLEKRQLEAFATHWLLTAITGPDFIDINDNGIADETDLGYWVSFEYGKWSDSNIWKNPYGENYLESPSNENLKTWIKGRKEIYYLDRVKTRTHTALFIKDQRNDNKSNYWQYSSVTHLNDLEQDENDYDVRFTIPTHTTLRLDKIILVKNENDIITNDSGPSSEGVVNILYNNSQKPLEIAKYESSDNILDTNDANLDFALDKSLKVIEFNHDYSLANGTPNSDFGRLTLNNVIFNGKNNSSLIPSYKFNYINDNYIFNIDDKDDFGYRKNKNDHWSLNEITTPQGGKIIIDYENHNFKPVFVSNIKFEQNNANYKLTKLNSTDFRIESDVNLGVQIGDQLDLVYRRVCVPSGNPHEGGGSGGSCGTNEIATVISNQGNNKFTIRLDTPVCNLGCGGNNRIYYNASYDVKNPIHNFGGIRVEKITVEDEFDSFSTLYKYGDNEDGIGYISYLPFAPELQEELPYSMELPSPRVMYEYTVVENTDASVGKVKYKFNILKEKDETGIKFGDFYEINKIETEFVNNVSNKVVSVAEFTVKDNLATLGQLLEVTTSNNQNHTLSKRINNYFTPGETPDLNGVVQESYQTYKEVDYDDNSSQMDRWVINSTSRIKYPNLMKSTQQIMNGATYTTNFNNINTDTGQYLETSTYDSTGNELKTKSVPAYKKYPEMGSKVENLDNKNMLSEAAASYTFIKKDGTWKPIGVGITTWNNDWDYRALDGTISSPTDPTHKIWRKHKSFIWDGDIDAEGVYTGFSVGNDDGFNWDNPNASPVPWKKVSETTMYDHYSMPLEVKDINDNYASTKMWDDETKVFSTSNAKYTEHFSSGAEVVETLNGTNYLGDGITLTTSVQSDEKSHTGEFSTKLGSWSKGFLTNLKAGEHREGKYKLSVWTPKDNYLKARVKHNGATAETFNGEVVIAGNWVQLNHYLDFTTAAQEVYVTSSEGNMYFDDYRLHPIESSVSSYVYNDYDELEATLGANNMATKYQYDDAGRLIRVWQEVADTPTITGGFKRASEYRYNYGRDIEGDNTGGSNGNTNTEVFFNNINQNDNSSPTTAILNAPPNSQVTYQVTIDCATNGLNGNGVVIVGNNNNSISCGTLLSNVTVTVPSSGQLACSIDQDSQGADPQDKTTVTIISSNNGNINTSQSSFYDRDLF